MRRCHFLKENKTRSFPHDMIFFDTETYTIKETDKILEQEMKLFTAVYHRHRDSKKKDTVQWTHGTHSDELLKFVLDKVRRKTCLNIFSANIWFDLRVSKLLELLLQCNFKIVKYFSNGKSFMIKMRRDTESIRFINIQNIFPVSVKALGKIIGLKKLDCDFEQCTPNELLTYCKRDTEIIYKTILFWLAFLKQHDLGAFGVTLATQAFNAYRHRFMPVKIAIHDNTKTMALERAGYFGGRTECFFIGKVKSKKTYILDINSQYPFVMKNNEYPYQLKYFVNKTSPSSLYKMLDKYCIMANCNLDTDEPVYAKRHEGKTVFPIGRFNTVLSTASFKHAFENNHIKEVFTAAVYLKHKIFKKWVTELYKLRVRYIHEKNKTMVYMIKRILNSLYGKFGQKTDNLIHEHQCIDIAFYNNRIYDRDEKKWYVETQVGNIKRLFTSGGEDAFNSFTAIAAHVTDYARLYLYQLIKQAGMTNVYYIDTDSLYTNLKGYKQLQEYIHKDKLGFLKLEKITSDLVIRGLKDYTIDGKTKIKGVPKKAKQINENTYKTIMFPGIKTDLQNKMSNNYQIHKVTKTLKREYTKGIIQSSGRIIPFSLSEF